MPPAPAVRLAEIAATPGRLSERAQALLHELGRHIPFDASWIALADPLSSGYSSLASTSLDQRTVQYLSGPEAAHDIEVSGTHRAGPPLSPSDLPCPAGDLPTWAECLTPAGFHEALAVGLFGPGQRHVGYLALLSAGTQPPAEALRNRLGAAAGRQPARLATVTGGRCVYATRRPGETIVE